MTSKGQITVPAKIRKSLGLREGDKLDFHFEKDGKLRVEVISGNLEDLRIILPKPKGRLSLEEMEKFIDQGGEK